MFWKSKRLLKRLRTPPFLSQSPSGVHFGKVFYKNVAPLIFIAILSKEDNLSQIKVHSNLGPSKKVGTKFVGCWWRADISCFSRVFQGGAMSSVRRLLVTVVWMLGVFVLNQGSIVLAGVSATSAQLPKVSKQTVEQTVRTESALQLMSVKTRLKSNFTGMKKKPPMGKCRM